MITKEQYEEYKRLVEEYEQSEYEDGMHEADESLSFNDDYDDNDDEYDSRYECTCGAWEVNSKTGRLIHVADCICGAE